jgi:hypothetical protein
MDWIMGLLKKISMSILSFLSNHTFEVAKSLKATYSSKVILNSKRIKIQGNNQFLIKIESI